MSGSWSELRESLVPDLERALQFAGTQARRIIADVLVDKYTDLAHTGWQLTREEVQRDVYGRIAVRF